MSSKNRNRQVIPSTPTVKEEPVENEQTQVPEEVQEENVSEITETTSTINQEETSTVETISTAAKEPEETVTIQPAKEGFKPVFKIELELTSYAEAMDKAKAIDPEEGGRWQYSLFTTIRNTLNNKSQEEFNKEWNTMLLFFNKNKASIFNENFMFRFPEQWPGSANEFTIFRRIVYTIIQTADPKARKKAIAEINLDMVTTGLTEAQRSNLLNFYG